MILDARQAASWLMGRGLLDAATINSTEVVIEPRMRRNLNFEVAAGPVRSCFLKQGTDASTRASIEREAAIYEYLSTGEERLGFGRYLPRLILFDRDECILVIELVAGAQDLEASFSGRGRPSVIVARQLGRALAALHSLDVATSRLEPRPSPSALWIAEPRAESLRELSTASIELATLLQQFPAFEELIAELRAEWCAPALTHWDLKASNCLVWNGGRGRRRTHVKLIDWELAGLGDPAWDVGSVLAGYLTVWAGSIPLAGDLSFDRCVALAGRPLVTVQPALRAFWEGYRTAGQPNADEQAFAMRAVRYAAARLMQTTLEHSQAQVTLTGTSLVLLQLAWNLLLRPLEAVLWLLGVP